MIRIYAILGLALTLVLGGLGGTVYVQHLQSVITAKGQAITELSQAKAALEKKIEVDAKVSANDAARAAEDVKRITTFKEKSRATIQGTKDPGHVALDADATQRVRDIFAQH